jgi:DNA (cytosine-5)-methyltransferase 1
MLTHASLFSGIGGFDLAAEWAGWENIFHCEWNPFGQKVLAHHFPNSKSYNDITKTNFTIHEGTVDVLTGGFPCQPYSTAGKRLGKADERHLFPEMLRAIKEIKPRWIIGENVRGLISWNEGLVFEEVCADLESEGYEVQPFLIPAASVNAPHRRDRIWFIAYSNNKGRGARFREIQNENGEISQRNKNAEFSDASNRDVANTLCKGLQGGQDSNKWNEFDKERANNGFVIRTSCKDNKQYSNFNFSKFPTQSPICGGNDGIPRSMDGITFSKWRNESIKAYGNAIVPQVALQIFKAINEFELSIK